MSHRTKGNGVRQFMQVTKISDGPDFEKNQKLVYKRYAGVSGVALVLLATLTKTWKPYKPIPSVTDMSDLTGKAKSQISLAYKELAEVGELWKVKRPNRAAEYYLNPELYWEGSLLAQAKHIASLKAQIRKNETLRNIHDLPEVVSEGEDLTPEELAQIAEELLPI